MSLSVTPEILLPPVWPPPLSLATTRGISVDFFSSGYLDVSVPRVPYVTLWIHVTLHGSSPCGFPHSEICGSKLICSSPQLIAACHVLLRLLMPRHSPCALLSLTFSIDTIFANSLEFSLRYVSKCFLRNSSVFGNLPCYLKTLKPSYFTLAFAFHQSIII